ncbi:MAG TPA: peptidoglycan DD-metalloendopeptidase family protein [Terriglobales bacterium]|nr:peptidoglycan DD-metalloendopeptidase family protein [Terriglobales bacterium]
MSKRFYILFVTRDAEGELRKIPIPLHYLYVFIVGALIGMLSITGMAGSYTRMLLKVTRFNQLRTEKEALKTRYNQLEQVAKEKDIQVASLGSLASEVSALYGLKSEPILKETAEEAQDTNVEVSLDQLYALRRSAMSGAATIGIGMGLTSRPASLTDWVRMAEAPNLWPVEGRITGAFGERQDPFNGEGAFHRGIDISVGFGTPILAPADGVVTFVGQESGYGRLIQIEHAQDISTRFGHLSAFAVTEGQHVARGQVIGYVGQSGRATGPHLHYEVWVHNSPVNPYKYLRISPTASFAGSV